MLGAVRIKVAPRDKDSALSFDEALHRSKSALAAASRLRDYTSPERLARALYHSRRYLRHLTDDDIHLRIGYLIANAVYVSGRNRYSTNNLYLNYWRTKLAHAAEELAIRNCTATISSDVLQHLPGLGFAIPQEPALKHDAKANAFFRYDKLKYIRKLQSLGEIKLRCGSTEDSTNDFARNDSNELCIRLQLLAQDLDLEFSSEALSPRNQAETLNINIHQKTDFFMFCLSEVYDWRLFGDFSAGSDSDDPGDKIACLVITDPDAFRKRFLSAAIQFLKAKASEFDHGFEVMEHRAHYYDSCDSDECAPLFEEPLLRPFAKRREYTYQHEVRFVIRPDLPANFVPAYSPADIPRFERAFLYLGCLDDISYVIEADTRRQDQRPYYISRKDLNVLAAAVGVTLPNSGDKFRFTYSVEVKEKGRVDAQNLMSSRRFQNGSVALHQQEIDIVLPKGGADILTALTDFYRAFDVREQGNHLIQFQTHLHPQETLMCEYRAYLACGEPADERIESSPVAFHFQYVFINDEGQVMSGSDLVAFDGHTYATKINGLGPLQWFPAYRSLLLAEMEFIRRIRQSHLGHLVSYECVSKELGHRLSSFSVTNPRASVSAPATQHL